MKYMSNDRSKSEYIFGDPLYITRCVVLRTHQGILKVAKKISKGFVCLLVCCVVLCSNNIEGHIRTGTDLGQCALMATL